MTSKEIPNTIEELLDSLIEETDDPDVHYKLRTALQLLMVHDENVRRLEEAVADNPELDDRLRDLGYLEE